jgi:mRNA-degrading endonuclease YafQ of YafQ-DinJ toxin-antitoxin module
VGGITSICTTDLFWETLGKHRGLDYYAHLRASLDDLIARKAKDTGPVNGRDKYFTIPHLRGTWHCALTRNPDVVLFYTIEGGTLNLAMLGNHHDYPSDKKNASAAERTATRIHNAIVAGHRRSPTWKSVAWKRPSDLVGHRELAEASPQALDAILSDLREEVNTGNAFRRLNGRDLLDGTIEELEAWLADVEAAHAHVLKARHAKPLSCEEIVERIASGRSLVA